MDYTANKEQTTVCALEPEDAEALSLTPPLSYLDQQDREVFQSTVDYVNNRMAESAIIDWTLQLKPADHIQRTAVAYLLNGPNAQILDEPWSTAWRLIQESWSPSIFEELPSTAINDIQMRLRAGDHSSGVVSAIVNLVAPRLQVEKFSLTDLLFIKKPRRPITFDDLLSATISSGELIDLNVLELANLTDVSFLNDLASALEGAVNHGLEIACRLGWYGQGYFRRMKMLARVYYVGSCQAGSKNKDPDASHFGLAPSIKLLHAVVTRIAELEPNAALVFIQRWRVMGSLIYTRLWAATAQNSKLIEAPEVAAFFTGLGNREFWQMDVLPEVAELRARRFGELDQQTQDTIVRRLRKGPPRDLWPKKAQPTKVKDERLYWAVLELKRVEVAGGNLASGIQAWLDAQIGQLGKLKGLSTDLGFLNGLPIASLKRRSLLESPESKPR
jgi:hypothetical protein